MTTAENRVVGMLQDLTGRRYVLPVGRGATAIYLAVEALAPSPRIVAAPGNLCYSALCPVLYAACRLQLMDVSLDDHNVSLHELETALAAGAKLVMVHHSYGHAAPLAAISRLCARAGARLIEDGAAAQGGTADGKPVGSWGDVSILSFGGAKIIDAGGGGALLTDDRVVYQRAQAALDSLPCEGPETRRADSEVVAIVKTLWSLRQDSERVAELFNSVWPLYRPAFLFRLPEAQAARIGDSLSTIDEVRALRHKSLGEYRTHLQHPGVQHPQVPDGSLVWRYTIRVAPNVRDALVSRLRQAGIHASTLYPSAADQFSRSRVDDRALPRCREAEASVVNLWLEPAADAEMVRRGASLVGEIMSEIGNGNR